MPENAKLWSPESPFLYTLKVSLKQNGKLVDEVSSYAAMRKYSSKRDANGIVRLELNNKPLFQFGPLDQAGGRMVYTPLLRMRLCYTIYRRQKILDLI